jgi:hypothetical protein
MLGLTIAATLAFMGGMLVGIGIGRRSDYNPADTWPERWGVPPPSPFDNAR